MWVSLFIKRIRTQKNLLNHPHYLVEKTIHHNVKHVWNTHVDMYCLEVENSNFIAV